MLCCIFYYCLSKNGKWSTMLFTVSSNSPIYTQQSKDKDRSGPLSASYILDLEVLTNHPVLNEGPSDGLKIMLLG